MKRFFIWVFFDLKGTHKDPDGNEAPVRVRFFAWPFLFVGYLVSRLTSRRRM